MGEGVEDSNFLRPFADFLILEGNSRSSMADEIIVLILRER